MFILKLARSSLRASPSSFSSLFSSSTRRFFASKILIFGEHDTNNLTQGTLSTITAATKLDGPVSLLIAGTKDAVNNVGKSAAKIKGINNVLLAAHDSLSTPLTEPFTSLLLNIHKSENFSHILAPSSSLSKSVLPRLAASLDVSPLTDVMQIKTPDTFVRPCYAGNVIITLQSLDPVKILIIRTTSFEKAGEGGNAQVTEVPVPDLTVGGLSKYEGVEMTKSERPELTSARVVVSGGRALKSRENFKIMENLADRLGAALGASRAAVDAGYAPNDWQVGQTGKIVAPDLYIAVGISGAIQHLAGMKDSKVIVAINKDSEAPIFQYADFGLVADLFTAVPELTKQVKQQN